MFIWDVPLLHRLIQKCMENAFLPFLARFNDTNRMYCRICNTSETKSKAPYHHISRRLMRRLTNPITSLSASLQNNIIIRFDMNFNFTLLSSVAKGAKWNFSFVPITLLPGVTFWRVEGHNGLWEGISGRITTNFFLLGGDHYFDGWKGAIFLRTKNGTARKYNLPFRLPPPFDSDFSLGSLGYFRK